MITKDKIDTYNSFGGDVDGFLKFGNKDKSSISDAEWSKIDGFIQDIQLISERKTAEEYTENTISELKKLCDEASFNFFVKKIPFYDYFMAVSGLTKIIESKISKDTEVGLSNVDDPTRLKLELTEHQQKLQNLSFKTLEKIKLHFLPTSTFQELAIANDWKNDYIELSNSFDVLYKAINSKKIEYANQSIWAKLKNLFK